MIVQSVMTTRSSMFKEFIKLFLPILLISFSSCLFLFIEKVLLAHLSVKEMEATITVTYISQIFQLTATSMAMMAQVFVARWHGSGQWKNIGPGIWQYIWFAFLSMGLTIPFGLVYGKYFLSGTPIKDIATPYFHFMIGINFLYPLGAALACFFIGQGKTKLVLFVTICSQFLKLILAYPLILGWGFIPSLGLAGAAISTLAAQLGLCMALFFIFLQRENNDRFQTRNWRFKPKLFLGCLQPGFFRAFNRILNITCWTSIAHLVTVKGGNYLLSLSIGGAISLFLPFFSDAICQTKTIIISRILGTGNLDLLDYSFQPGLILTVIFSLIIAVPLLFFPTTSFDYLFPTITLDPTSIKAIFFGTWISFVFYTCGYICVSYILAYKDMLFSLFVGLVNWINGYLLMYFLLEIVEIPSYYFWQAHSLMHGTTTIIYFFRVRKLCKRSQLDFREKKV